MRPWIKINGHVHKRVRDYLLATLLCHIMMKTGCSLKSLYERYVPALQPMHIRDLVEVLVKMGCVTMRKIRKTSCKLFEDEDSIEIEDATTVLDEADELFVDAEVDAVSKLASKIDNGTFNFDLFKCPCHA